LDICQVVKSGVVACDDKRLKKLIVVYGPGSPVSRVLGFRAGSAITAEVILKLVSVFSEIVQRAGKRCFMAQSNRMAEIPSQHSHVPKVNVQWLVWAGKIGHTEMIIEVSGLIEAAVLGVEVSAFGAVFALALICGFPEAGEERFPLGRVMREIGMGMGVGGHGTDMGVVERWQLGMVSSACQTGSRLIVNCWRDRQIN